MTSIEKMMRNLLQEQKEDTKQMIQEQKSDNKRAIENAIAQHVQLLNAASAREGTSRVQAISNVQNHFNELREELRAFISEPGQRVRDGRSGEVVIGDFGLKSKEGAIRLVQQIIE